MVVSAVNTNTAAAATATKSEEASKKATLDYEMFLNLLVAQLKNQDPTEPMDTTEQVAQLATFSQVEQTIQTNKRLEEILQSSNLNQATSVIGRTLTSSDGLATGVVEQVRVGSDGLTAVLRNGQEIAIGAGVVIR